MNWKFSICLLIFFWFHGALGSLIDQIDGETGDLINKADPTISDQMKEMLKMTPVWKNIHFILIRLTNVDFILKKKKQTGRMDQKPRIVR